MTEMLCTSIMTETMEVQYATAERTGSVELQKGGKNVKLCEVSASGLARVVGDFHGQFQQQLQRQEHMYAGPGLILAKAAFLSAEAVLTDSLLAALVTGAACEAVQSIISLVSDLPHHNNCHHALLQSAACVQLSGLHSTCFAASSFHTPCDLMGTAIVCHC